MELGCSAGRSCRSKVDIEIVQSALDVPGFYFAQRADELEVELIVDDDFLDDDEIVAR